MADNTTTQTVLIDFQTDVTGIQTAVDVLEQTGAIDKKLADQFKRTNAEINNQQKAINNTAKAFQDAAKKETASIEEVRAYMENFVADFVAGFQEGVVDELKNAGIQFDEFGKVITQNTQTSKKDFSSLKAELSDITKRMAVLKLEGNETGQEFLTLARRAGNIRDALGDVSKEINRFASDTKSIDGLIDLASGAAGAFAVMQGAAGAFGAEGEKVQEVLLKVNSALAILQGLQQVGNLLTKDSAAVTTLNTFAQQGYNFAIGQSIGLLKAFRIALALTGIGAVIVGITLLVQWLNKSSKAIEQNTKALEKLNAEFERDVELLDQYVGEIQRATDERIAALTAQGATEKQLRAERLNLLKEEQNGVFEIESAYRAQAAAARQLLQDVATGARTFNEKEVEAAEAVLKTFESTTARRKQLSTELRVQSIEDAELTKKEQLQAAADSLDAQLALAAKNSDAQFNLARQSARARAAVERNEAGQNTAALLLIQANLQKRLDEIDLEQRRVRQQNRIDALELALLKEQEISQAINARNSQAEIDLQKKLIQERARLELLQEGLTANQKLLITRNALAEQARIQREFNQQVSRETLEDFISNNNAELTQLNLSHAERLRLTEENIIAQAEIEIQANEGLAAKIVEIQTKRDADIKAARLAVIEETLNYELELEAARTGALRRGQQQVLQDQRSTLNQRIAAINQLAVLDIAAINARQDALEQERADELISQEEYILRYEQLKDQEVAIVAQAEKAKKQLIRDQTIAAIQFALQLTQSVADVFKTFMDNALAEQEDKLKGQKQEIEDLLEAGAITEKEAERRRKRLEVEERRLRRQQAQREKDFAVFKALISIPQAFLTGLVQGGPILGAIYAALAAAQAIAIAARDVPKFGTGKRNQYEGPAEIGETGPEIWQTDNGMHYVQKRSLVWVSKNDKVFNPSETRRMLQQPAMHANSVNQTWVQESGGFTQIDYEKLGAAVGKNIPQVGFNFDQNGFLMWQQGKTSLIKYLDKRRGYN